MKTTLLAPAVGEKKPKRDKTAEVFPPPPHPGSLESQTRTVAREANLLRRKRIRGFHAEHLMSPQHGVLGGVATSSCTNGSEISQHSQRLNPVTQRPAGPRGS